MKKHNILLVGLMFAVGLFFYQQLPDSMPMHWDLQGQIDNYMPKQFAVWVFPALALLCLLLFKYIPNFDPKKDKYKLFEREWNIIQTAFILFFFYMQGVVYFLSMHPNEDIKPLMFFGLGMLFVLLGNYMSKIRQNYFIGVRTPWSLADEDNWNKTHRFASWTFVLAGLVMLAETVVQWNPAWVIFPTILVAVFSPVWYSWRLYGKR